MGEIQPVGGISAKIEGFYAACKTVGLTGEQGVIIPAKNRNALMLKKEIVEAVENGDFNIYSINTVDEGLELLTGLEVGGLEEDGTFTKDSFNEKVLQKLISYNQTMRKEATEDARGAETDKK
jgi:predicted ATP-dependent protease